MNGWCGGCPREHWRIQHGSDGKKEKENENEKEKEKPSFIIGGSPDLDKRCRSLFVYTTVLLHDEWPIDSFSSSSSSTSSSSSGGETVGHCWTLLDTARCFSSVLRSISNRVIRSIPIKLAGQFCILPSVSNLINVRKEKKHLKHQLKIAKHLEESTNDARFHQLTHQATSINYYVR